MSESNVVTVHCVCPECGGNLAGLDTDRVFFCPVCRLGVTFKPPDLTVHPVTLIQPLIESKDMLLYLPIWRFDITLRSQCEDPNKSLDISKLEYSQAYIIGFKMRGLQVYGDLNQTLTQKQPNLTIASHPFMLTGCRKPVAQAEQLLNTLLLSLIDRKVDVTGVTLVISIRNTQLLAVPFYDQGSKLMDGILGETIIARAVSDLPGLRAAAGANNGSTPWHSGSAKRLS